MTIEFINKMIKVLQEVKQTEDVQNEIKRLEILINSLHKRIKK